MCAMFKVAYDTKDNMFCQKHAWFLIGSVIATGLIHIKSVGTKLIHSVQNDIKQ